MPDTVKEIDTFNKCLVAVLGDNVVIMRPMNRLSRADALLLAAWLVALAEENDGEFARVLAAVQST